MSSSVNFGALFSPARCPRLKARCQPRVTGGPVGQHEQMIAVRIGSMMIGHETGGDLLLRVVLVEHLPGGGCTERDLGAEHRRQADGPRRFGKADDAVETVVIGDGQRFETETGSFLRQLLGVRGAVEEREVGVAVQLCIRHRRRIGTQQRPGLIGLGAWYGWRLRLHAGPSPPAFHAGEPGAAHRPAAAGRWAVGERCFELPPRHVRVVEPHKEFRLYRTLVRTQEQSAATRVTEK